MWSLSFCDGGVYAVHRCRRVRAFAHEHDAFHDIVIVYHHAVRSMNGPSDLARGESSVPA